MALSDFELPGSAPLNRRRFLVSATLTIAGSVCLTSAYSDEINVANPGALQPVTLRDCIDSTRAMLTKTTLLGAEQDEYVVVSPDGMNYALMLVRGDSSADMVVAEIVTGGLRTIDDAVPKISVQLRTSGLGSSAELTLPVQNAPRWLDDSRTIVLSWTDEVGVVQGLRIDAVTSAVAFVTEHPTDVTTFNVNERGDVVYSALVAHSRDRTNELLNSGFTVTNEDAWGFMNGDADGHGIPDLSNSEWFIKSAAGATAKVRFPSNQINLFAPGFPPIFSPDGRRAIVNSSPASILPEWRAYTHPDMKMRIEAGLQGSHNTTRLIQQLFVVNLQTESARPLWRAPNGAVSGRPLLAWSRDGSCLLVGPTFLPIENANTAGLAGTAIASIDVASGAFAVLPLPDEAIADGLIGLQWLAARDVEVVCRHRVWRCKLTAQGWRLVNRLSRTKPPVVAPIAVELRQDIDTPPKIVAVHTRSGRSRVVRDMNPQLATKDCGVAELLEFEVPDRGTWRGVLYRPREKRSGKLPLVVQSRGQVLADEFSLWGPGGINPGVGPGYVAYAARVLAGCGIAVIQVDDNRKAYKDIADEPEVFMHAYRRAIERVELTGLIDPSRVGLMGFSRAAWRITYALVHDDFKYAAAIAADGLSGGYIGAALQGWSPDFTELLNGTKPFGEGLERWVSSAPPFLADRIRTPLQIQYGAGLKGMIGAMGQWEMFSRLRRLQKPVELYILPEIGKGNHGLQNPRQSLASKERAVDWWRFWLQDYEDSDARKIEQYATWRILREQRDRSA